MMSSPIKLLALFFVFASLATVNGWRIKSRIVGGSSAIEKQFPYQVSLRMKKNDKHFCGAAIIKPYYILTAAHCFFHIPGKTASIYGVVNKTHATDSGNRIELLTLIMHPDFGERSPQPDIALLRTTEAITFSDFVQPINLPTEEYIKPGSPVIISGWGLFKVEYF